MKCFGCLIKKKKEKKKTFPKQFLCIFFITAVSQTFAFLHFFFMVGFSSDGVFSLLDKQRYLGYCLYLIEVKRPLFSYASGRH